MVSPRHSVHGQWSSRFIFVVALVGSAVGLGNVWKFPYLAGENGGGAFVLVYLLCTAFIGLPLMAAEILIGRRARRSPIVAMRNLALEEGRSSLWAGVGWLATVAAVLILAAYSVVGGWAMAYVFRAASGAFVGVDAYQASQLFRHLTGDPERLLAWHTLFVAVTVMVVARGVRYGLEEAVRWFMPLLIGLMLLLVWYAWRYGAFAQAVDFLFRPDFSALGAGAVLAALGHAFFTLSLGMGAVMAYAAYAGERVPVLQVSLMVVLADVAVALLAGLATFPLVFSNGLAPSSGPGLVFETLPLAFGAMADGEVYGTLFFAMLMFAAWTSSISLLEPAVAYLVERWRVERPLAASYLGITVWTLGLIPVFSFNIWSHVRPLEHWPLFQGRTLFDLMNFVSTNLMLPVVGLAVAIFAGWRLAGDTSRLEMGRTLGYRLWLVVIRFITPVAVLIVLLNSTGVVDLIIAE